MIPSRIEMPPVVDIGSLEKKSYLYIICTLLSIYDISYAAAWSINFFFCCVSIKENVDESLKKKKNKISNSTSLMIKYLNSISLLIYIELFFSFLFCRN